MSTTDIDLLVTDFYQILSFKTDEVPDLDQLEPLFYDDAVLINNTYGKPLKFTPEEFAQGIQTKVADGSMQQFIQKEVFSKTEIFGKIAQRVSVYEYSFSDPTTKVLPRGINFIQCIQSEGNWVILSMAWNDENENNIIPHEYHINR